MEVGTNLFTFKNFKEYQEFMLMPLCNSSTLEKKKDFQKFCTYAKNGTLYLLEEELKNYKERRREKNSKAESMIITKLIALARQYGMAPVHEYEKANKNNILKIYIKYARPSNTSNLIKLLNLSSLEWDFGTILVAPQSKSIVFEYDTKNEFTIHRDLIEDIFSFFSFEGSKEKFLGFMLTFKNLKRLVILMRPDYSGKLGMTSNLMFFSIFEFFFKKSKIYPLKKNISLMSEVTKTSTKLSLHRGETKKKQSQLSSHRHASATNNVANAPEIVIKAPEENQRNSGVVLEGIEEEEEIEEYITPVFLNKEKKKEESKMTKVDEGEK